MAQGRPRVELRELDLSTTIEGSNLFPVGIVGFAEKGPIGVPTLVTNLQQFNQIFGRVGWEPSYLKSYASHAVDFYFREGNSVWFVRGDTSALADADASRFAALDFPVDSTASAVSGSLSANAADVYDVTPTGMCTGTTVERPTGSVALRVSARSKGAWANQQLYIAVLNYGFFRMAASSMSGLFTWAAVSGDSELSGVFASSTVASAVNGSMGNAPSLSFKPTNSSEFYLGIFNSAGQALEQYVLSFMPSAIDSRGYSIFVEDVINNQSQYISAFVNAALTAGVSNSGVGSPDFVEFVSGGNTVFNFASAGSGYTNNGKYDPSACKFSTLASSVSALMDNNTYNLRAIAAPGATWADAAATVTMLKTVAETRKDCVAVVDLCRASITSAVQDRTKSGINSTYVATYYNWFNYYDALNDKYMYLPPSVQVLRNFAFTYKNYAPWYAPAGRLRGTLQNVLNMDYKLTDGDLDYLANSQCNPLVRLPSEGNVIWGQKASYSLASDFRDLNIRFLFIELEQAIAAYCRSFIFEFNDVITRSQARTTIEGYLRTIQQQRGIMDFRVICDDTNNPDPVISANEMVIDVFIKATKAIEVVKLNFIATRDTVTINR